MNPKITVNCPHFCVSKIVMHSCHVEVNQNKVLKNARRKLLDAASSFGVCDSVCFGVVRSFTHLLNLGLLGNHGE